MRYLLVKNKRLYKLFYKFELTRLQYKSVFFNRCLPFYIRQHAFELLNLLNQNGSFVAIRNRCFMTNKSRSVVNHFKISRIKLRLLISNNLVNGVKKSSW